MYVQWTNYVIQSAAQATSRALHIMKLSFHENNSWK